MKKKIWYTRVTLQSGTGINKYNTYMEFWKAIKALCIHEEETGPNSVEVAERIFTNEEIENLAKDIPQDLKWFPCEIQYYREIHDGYGLDPEYIIDTNTSKLYKFREWKIMAHGRILPNEIEEEGRLEMAGGKK